MPLSGHRPEPVAKPQQARSSSEFMPGRGGRRVGAAYRANTTNILTPDHRAHGGEALGIDEIYQASTAKA